MKSLKENVILYDEVCPMCNLYTKAFIKAGMLDENGRATYQSMPSEFRNIVDKERAVNEIALVDRQTGEVTYGIKSLFKILQFAAPPLKCLFNFTPFAWLCDKAYKFISYNRRIIMPPPKEKQYPGECNPSFHKGYRLSFLIVSWLLTALILNKFTANLEGILPAGSFYRELLMCGGQIFWQLLVIRFIAPQKSWDYLGNMMTISLAGAIILGILKGITGLLELSYPLLHASAFLLVVSLMFLEHIRRTRLLELPGLLTASWVLYRILLLFIIL